MHFLWFSEIFSVFHFFLFHLILAFLSVIISNLISFLFYLNLLNIIVKECNIELTLFLTFFVFWMSLFFWWWTFLWLFNYPRFRMVFSFYAWRFCLFIIKFLNAASEFIFFLTHFRSNQWRIINILSCYLWFLICWWFFFWNTFIFFCCYNIHKMLAVFKRRILRYL